MKSQREDKISFLIFIISILAIPLVCFMITDLDIGYYKLIVLIPLITAIASISYGLTNAYDPRVVGLNKLNTNITIKEESN